MQWLCKNVFKRDHAGTCDLNGQTPSSKKPKLVGPLFDLKHPSKLWSLSYICWITTQTKHLTKQAGVPRALPTCFWHRTSTSVPSGLCVSLPCTCPPVWRAGSGKGRWTVGHTHSSPRLDTGYRRWSGPQSSCQCRTSRGRRVSAACWTLGCW